MTEMEFHKDIEGFKKKLKQVTEKVNEDTFMGVIIFTEILDEDAHTSIIHSIDDESLEKVVSFIKEDLDCYLEETLKGK